MALGLTMGSLPGPAAAAVPWTQRAFTGGGLGAGLGALFGGPDLASVDPATAQALRNQAILRMGLGMMAGSEGGLGFGQSALAGLNSASTNYLEAMQSAFRNQVAKRAQEREDKAFEFQRDVTREEGNRWRIEVGEQRKDREIRTKAIEAQVRQADAAIEAARAGLEVDAEQLRQAREYSTMAAPLLAKLRQGIPLTAQEEQLLNLLTGGTVQGLTSAKSGSLWGNLGANLGGPNWSSAGAAPSSQDAILGIWDQATRGQQ